WPAAQAAQAAASHTGALAGNDEVLTAAFRRTGVLRVDSIADLFDMAETLAKQPRPKGRRLSLLPNAGGPAVLATDALVAAGGEPAPGSPVDLLGSADAETYAKALERAGEDKECDGILAILAPQDRTDPTATAEHLKVYAHRYSGKPVLASWMGGAQVAAGRRILSDADIPTFNYPDTAARMFSYMWKYTYNLRGLYETPALTEEATLGHDKAAEILRAARSDRRTLHRAGVEARPRDVRHPHRGDARRSIRRTGRPRGGGARLPDRGQAELPDRNAQERRGRGPARSAQRARGARRVRGHPRPAGRARPAGRLRRRHRAAHDSRGGVRADRGQQR